MTIIQIEARLRELDMKIAEVDNIINQIENHEALL